jgi:hypothetical protein
VNGVNKKKALPDHSKELRADRSIILKCVLKEQRKGAKCIQYFGGKNLKVDDRELLTWILKKHNGIHLAQDRDQWQSPVNTVTNIGVQQNLGGRRGFLYQLSKSVASEAGLCSMKSLEHVVKRWAGLR